MEEIIYKRFGENPDPAQEKLERILMENIYWQRKAEHLEELINPKILTPKKPQKRKEISKSKEKRYELFIKEINKQGLSPEAIFNYSNEKRSLLREVFGYTKLKGGKSLDECSDSQIGKAFKNIYKTAIKSVKNYS
jgi:hypothetical protein